MDTIAALVADPSAPGHLARRDVAAPVPGPNEVLVAVKAVSLNRGEVRALQSATDGWRPGWDLAGVVLRRAADGSGPHEGTRVVGLAASGSWAEQVAVASDLVAPLPDAVNFAAAATLPVAGLTALRALELADTIDGHAVAVTGASGGVGRFAVQLASQLGATVTAVVSSPERGRPLLDLGAAVYALELPADGSFTLVLESVGGATLGQALGTVADGGLVVSYGNSSGQPTTFDVSTFYHRAGARLYGFALMHELRRSRSGTRDLARLATMVAENRLDVGVEREGGWNDAPAVVAAFWERRLTGKAVLLLD